MRRPFSTVSISLSVLGALLLLGCDMQGTEDVDQNLEDSHALALSAVPTADNVAVQYSPEIAPKTCTIGTMSSANQFDPKSTLSFDEDVYQVLVNKNRRVLAITTAIVNGSGIFFYYSGLLNPNYSVTWNKAHQQSPAGNSSGWNHTYQTWAMNSSGQVVNVHWAGKVEKYIYILYGQIQADGSIAWLGDFKKLASEATYADPNSIAIDDSGRFIALFEYAKYPMIGKSTNKLNFFTGTISGNTLTGTGYGTIRSSQDSNIIASCSMDNNGLVTILERFDHGDQRQYLRVGKTSGNTWVQKSLTVVSNNGPSDRPRHMAVNYTVSPYKAIFSYESVLNKKVVAQSALINPSTGAATLDATVILSDILAFPGTLPLVSPTVWYKVVSRANRDLGLDADNLAKGSVTNGSNVQTWTFTGGMNQQWGFIDNGNSTYRIVNRANPAVALDADTLSGPVGNNTNAQVWTYAGTSNQQWQVVFDSSGFSRILSQANPTYCVDGDIATSSLHDGSNVHMWQYTGGANQTWELVAVQ